MARNTRRAAKRSLFISLSLSLVIALLLCACGGETEEEQAQKVKIGLSLGFTGALASGTTPVSEGVLAYMKYVNDQGGIEYEDPDTGDMQQALLDIDWEDNFYAVDKTLSVYKRQKEWGMNLQVLVMSPDVIADQASRSEVPVMSAGNLAKGSMEPEPRYVSVLYGSYVDQILAFTEWASEQQTSPPKIGFLALDIPAFSSAAGGGGLTEELVSQYGGELVGVERVPMTVTDMTIELTRLKDANPDWIILQLVPSSIAVAMKDAQRIGMPETTKFIAITTYGEDLIPLLGDLSEGFYGMLSWSFASETDVAGVQLAHDVMNTYYGRPANTSNVWGVALAMIAVGGIEQALESVGIADLSPSDVNDALHSLTNFDTMGLTIPVSMTEDYPAASEHIKIGVIEGGVIERQSNWIELPRIGLTLE